jgi:hypothetical protein
MTHRGYSLVVTKSDACHTCHVLEKRGLFASLEKLKPKEVSEVFIYSFTTLSQSPDVGELFNKNMWFPNFKIVSNEAYEAAVDGASFRSLASQVRFYNAEYDPLIPIINLRETPNHYPEIPTLESVRDFCRDSIASMKAGVSLTEYFEGHSQVKTAPPPSHNRLRSTGDEYWLYRDRR